MVQLKVVGLLIAGALFACSPRPLEQSVTPELPALQNLPHKTNEDCGCLQQNRCLVVEAPAGAPEVRNLTCRWVETGKSAQCAFEERWVYQSDAEQWQTRSLRAVAMTDGRWCAAN